MESNSLINTVGPGSKVYLALLVQYASLKKGTTARSRATRISVWVVLLDVRKSKKAHQSGVGTLVVLMKREAL